MLNLLGKGYKLFSVATNSFRRRIPGRDGHRVFCAAFLTTSNNKWTVYDKSGNAYYFGEVCRLPHGQPQEPAGAVTAAPFIGRWTRSSPATGDWDRDCLYQLHQPPLPACRKEPFNPAQIAYNGHTNFNGYFRPMLAGPDKNHLSN